MFPEVNELIAAVKAATIENKERRILFTEIGSPPQSILTRWASWIRAAAFYAEHLPAVVAIVEFPWRRPSRKASTGQCEGTWTSQITERHPPANTDNWLTLWNGSKALTTPWSEHTVTSLA